MWPPPPRELPVRRFSALPSGLRQPRRTAWSDANRAGAAIDSFLEGPCFDAAGAFYVSDIPNGRIFRVKGEAWELIAEYEGWPNGLAAREGELLITDYRHGLLSLAPATGAIAPVLENVLSEGFRGLNDLVVDAAGNILFTDQGQTGLQDPSGRVWRLGADGRIDRLIGNGPSPNGIALNAAGTHCYVAMTRSCEVWRFALRGDAVVGKANCFFRVPAGTSGPDGMAVDAADRLFIANPGHGQVWGVDPHGMPLFRLDCTGFGRMPTNCCLTPDGRTLLITESQSGTVLAADIPLG
ncbi:SMP-30/gluconolactonase/LRE family protein [Siccirubricoccus sp. KC 17139]|uniref:SMP-30/gluconolactonase/LRE family protein n=1 Tax=Siccirubricoccus soli TaxID=2899147 RepID=A0ABT1D8W8_9PROT|nr:SMP-30/gluconolactonase/LRE family protein [Siccirubricoccus soli]MCO6417629.1 SMP-30/gluconolactonase/LRE family protein [Siccirubricoccus soli]MCP2683764.1 SMP-30/gluconolactonase/LRE family protein [Siccirubricoccus soli]